MEHHISPSKLKMVNESVAKIVGLNKYLQKFKVRESLEEWRRQHLVDCQIEKAQLIVELKVAVRHSEDVPQSIRNIYF